MERCQDEVSISQDPEAIFPDTSRFSDTTADNDSTTDLCNLDNSELPSWASRHNGSQDLHSSLAECQVSQKISPSLWLISRHAALLFYDVYGLMFSPALGFFCTQIMELNAATPQGECGTHVM